MTEAEALKDAIRKASSQAIKAKMDLHDLTEELPLGWDTIPDLARKAFDAYKLLDELKSRQ